MVAMSILWIAPNVVVLLVWVANFANRHKIQMKLAAKLICFQSKIG